MVYIVEYARSKGIEFALEQPSSSLAPLYRPFLKMMKRTGARSISVPLGAWGARTETHDVTSWNFFLVHTHERVERLSMMCMLMNI